MKRTYLLALIAIFSILYSCDKEEVSINDKGEFNYTSQEKDNQISDDIIYPQTIFFIDNIRVSSKEFENRKGEYYISASPLENSTDKSVTNAFSSRELYIQWGKINGYKVEKLFEFTDAIHTFIENSNIEEIVESTGEVPTWYLEFENKTYTKIFGESQKTEYTEYHKDYNGGDHMIFFRTNPILFGAWNNEISAFTQLGFYGNVHLYNRSWYRSGLMSYWGFGRFHKRYLRGAWSFANDKTTSLMSSGV